MTTTYQSGRRIQGTSTDFGTAGAGIAGVSGGWKELGRTTLGSAGDALDVSSLADKRYYMVLTNGLNSGAIQGDYRFNSDTGSNYAYRRSINGGTDGTSTSASLIFNGIPEASAPQFGVGYVANLSTKEKLILSHTVGRSTAGAATAPSRGESVGKHSQTSVAINKIDLINDGSGSWETGSEIVVLGWDDSDTHSTNFWEELASVELGSAGDNLSSGTFTAKKYLWVQAFTKNSGAINAKFTFNNDTASNYSYRYSYDSNADSTSTSATSFQINVANNNAFYNLFIINNSATEKLVIGNMVDQMTAGAGTAPSRLESVSKWANTSSQITEIDIDNTAAGSFDTGSIIKVWGSN